MQLNESALSRIVESKYVKTGIINSDEYKMIYDMTLADKTILFITELYIWLKQINNVEWSPNLYRDELEKTYLNLHDYLKTSNLVPILSLNHENFTKFITDNRITNRDSFETIDIIFSRRYQCLNILNSLPKSVRDSILDKHIIRDRRELYSFLEDLKKIKSEFDKKSKLESDESYPFFINRISKPSSTTNMIKNLVEYNPTDLVNPINLKNLLKECEDSQLIVENSNYSFVKCSSKNDVNKLGCNTDWCIVKDREFWSNYIAQNGSIYLLYNWKTNVVANHLIGFLNPFLLPDRTISDFMLQPHSGVSNTKNRGLELDEIIKIWSDFIKTLTTDQIEIVYSIKDLYIDDKIMSRDKLHNLIKNELNDTTLVISNRLYDFVECRDEFDLGDIFPDMGFSIIGWFRYGDIMYILFNWDSDLKNSTIFFTFPFLTMSNEIYFKPIKEGGWTAILYRNLRDVPEAEIKIIWDKFISSLTADELDEIYNLNRIHNKKSIIDECTRYTFDK